MWFADIFSQLFYSLNSLLNALIILNFDEVPFIMFFHSWVVLLVWYLKTLLQTQGHADFFLFLWFL